MLVEVIFISCIKKGTGDGEEGQASPLLQTIYFLHYSGKRVVDLDTINIHIFQPRNVSIWSMNLLNHCFSWTCASSEQILLQNNFKFFPTIHCVHFKGNMSRSCYIKKQLCNNTNEQQCLMYNITHNTYWHKYPITMESLHELCRSAITRSNGMKSCSFKIYGYLEKRELIKDSLLHVIFISISI